MKTASAKAKGQRASKELRDLILQFFPELSPDDVHVVPAGVNGEDLWLSPKARRLLPYSFEVKNQERLNIHKSLEQAEGNTPSGSKPVLAFKKNRTPMYVAVQIQVFLGLISELVHSRSLAEQSTLPQRDRHDYGAAI